MRMVVHAVKIKIHRKSRLNNRWVNAYIEVDGNEQYTLKNGQTVEIKVGLGEHEILVYIRSMTLEYDHARDKFVVDREVEDGDYEWIYDNGKLHKQF